MKASYFVCKFCYAFLNDNATAQLESDARNLKSPFIWLVLIISNTIQVHAFTSLAFVHYFLPYTSSYDLKHANRSLLLNTRVNHCNTNRNGFSTTQTQRLHSQVQLTEASKRR